MHRESRKSRRPKVTCELRVIGTQIPEMMHSTFIIWNRNNAIMASFLRALNILLPFTDPSRPLWRDVLHALLLCTILYLGPHIRIARIGDLVAWLNKQQTHAQEHRGHEESNERIRDAGVVAQDEAEPLQDDPANHEVVEAVENEASDNFRDRLDNPPTAQAFNIAPNVPQPRRRDPNRIVGSKKAKSLARRDRVRAYNEFLREQGDAQRAKDAEGSKEREEVAARERDRRKAVEERIQADKAKERAERKEREAEMREEEEAKRRKLMRLVGEMLERGTPVKLHTAAKMVGKDRGWVEGVIKREGLLGMKDIDGQKVLTMFTKNGYLVQVDEALMQKTYREVDSTKFSDDDDSNILERIRNRLEEIMQFRMSSV